MTRYDIGDAGALAEQFERVAREAAFAAVGFGVILTTRTLRVLRSVAAEREERIRRIVGLD